MKTLQRYIFEIIVIFIGITLSFLFDEWRESQKEEKKEVNIYQSILRDMEADIGRLDRVNYSSTQGLIVIDTLFWMIQHPLSDNDSFSKFALSFYMQKEPQQFLPSFKSALNDNSLSLIKNPEILRLCYTIIDNEKVLNQMIANERHSAGLLWEHIFSGYPGIKTYESEYHKKKIERIPESYKKKYLNDLIISDRLIFVKLSSNAVIFKTDQIKNQLEQLRILIDKELPG